MDRKDRTILFRLTFMQAFFYALAGMPTTVFQICRRQVGTLNVEPWLQKLTALRGATRSLLAYFQAEWRSFVLPAAAAALLVMLVVADLSAADSGVSMAIVLAGTAPELRDQANKLGTDMKAILDKAASEQRELTQDEARQFDAMDQDRNEVLAKERRLLVLASLDEGQGRRSDPVRQPSPENRGSRGETRQISLTDGVRAWLLAGNHPDKVTDSQRQAAQALGFRMDSKQITLRLPEMPLRSMREVAEWERRALSSSSTTSPVDGQYTVQNELMRPIEEALLAFGGVRRVATILRTTTGADLPIPTDNDTSNTGEIIGQNSPVNEQDVAFSQLTLQAFKYSSKMVKVSVEFLQDSTLSVADFLGRKLGTRIGRITNTHFTTGDASSKPNGIVTAAANSNVQLAALVPTYAEMVQIQHSVDPAYRDMPGCGWMFADSMLSAIKQIVDASTGRPIWVPSMAGGEPDTILGKPFTVNQAMAAAAASGAGRSIIFGDLSKYLIRDVQEITLMRLDERFAEYHQVAFLAFSRHDGDLLDAGTNPVKYARNKS